MVKKRFLILILLVLALCTGVYAQTHCCIDSQGRCDNIAPGDPCVGEYNDTACSNIDSCDITCCYVPPNDIEPRQKTFCPSDIQFKNLPFLPEGQLSDYDDDCSQCTEDYTIMCEGVPVKAAFCVAGQYQPGNPCAPAPTPSAEDSDGDGVLDSAEECPLEPALTVPQSTTEINCTDGIDNDCDGRWDMSDPDCTGAMCIQDERCPDDPTIIRALCDENGILIPINLCPSEVSSPTGYCGDNQIQTPNSDFHNEECEISSVATDCGAGAECIDCNCYYGCSEDPGDITIMSVTSDGTMNTILWNFDSPNNCNLGYFDIYRCSSFTGTCAPTPSNIIDRLNDPAVQTSYEYYDSYDLDFNLRYCYKIAAYFNEQGGPSVESQVICTGTGDQTCTEHPAEYCDENRTAIMWCQKDNLGADRESVKQVCPTDQFCMQQSEDVAACVPKPPCGHCNDVLRMFGIVQSGLDACADEQFCFLDYTHTNVDKFYACQEISDCYGYASEEACGNAPGEDACGLYGSESQDYCEWIPYSNGYIKSGVCRPSTTQDVECGECSTSIDDILNMDPKFNKIFGICTPETCEAYGDTCLFVPYINDIGSCEGAEDLGCRAYYDNQAYCNSGQDVDVDVSYDGNVRNGGTNIITQNSSDKFGYGTCKWDGTICIKDADGDGQPDCGAMDWNCIQDNEPPSTVIHHEGYDVDSNGDLIIGRLMDLEVGVSEAGNTSFCIGNCYPDLRTACRIQYVFDENEVNGQDNLRYYTEDLAHNLEPVQSMPVIFDTSSPQITVTPSVTTNGLASELSINLNANEEVTCNGRLEDAIGVIVTAHPESDDDNAIDGEIGTSFTRTYYGLMQDTYYYVYDCYDKAKNKAKGKEIIDIDTNMIHNPAPSGPINYNGLIPLSIQTDQEAECRYKESTSHESYEQMHLMNTTDGLFHHVDVDVNCQNCFKSYDVLCNIGGTVQGEANDKIRFAVDMEAPRIIAYASMQEDIEFLSDMAFGTDQTLYLRCMDDSVKRASGVENFDFGCTDVTYWIDNDPQITVQDDVVPIGPLVIDDTSLISTITTDEGGNIGYPTVNVLIDRTNPITINLMDLKTNAIINENDEIAPGTYVVVVRSTGLIQDAQATAEIELPISLGGGTITRQLLAPPASAYEARFLLDLTSGIPLGTFQSHINVEVTHAKPGSQCTMEGVTTELLTSSDQFDFFLDTNVPTINLEPLFDGNLDALDSGGEIDFIAPGYNVFRYNGTYFTNLPDLFVTGYMGAPNITESVNFYYGPSVAELSTIGKSYDVAANNVASPFDIVPSSFALGVDASAGDERLIMDDKGSELANSLYDALLIPGTYFWLNHSGIRTEYGYYGDFYSATNRSSYTLYLDGTLKEDVPEGFVPIVYQGHPYNWFGENLELQQGQNYLVVKAKKLGSSIEYSSDIFSVVLDTHAPEIYECNVYPGSTGTAIDEFRIKVKEPKGKAELNTDSLALTLYTASGEKSASPQVIRSEDASFKYYELVVPVSDLNLGETLPDGEYVVSWEGIDKAGNSLQPYSGSNCQAAYSLVKDDGLPLPPVIDVLGANEKNDIFYMKTKPTQVRVDFSEANTNNTEHILLTGLFHRSGDVSEGGTPFDASTSCVETSTNVYLCDFNNAPLDMNFEQGYRFVVEARRDTPNSPIGKYLSDLLVLDDQNPEIIDGASWAWTQPRNINMPLDSILSTDNTEMFFTFYIPNEYFDIDLALEYYGDAMVYPMELVAKNGHEYTYKWNIGDYNVGHPVENLNQLDFTFTDGAGNVGTTNGLMRMDLVPPDATQTNIEINVPLKKPTEWVTNQQTVQITGTIGYDDLAAVYIEPGTWANGDYSAVTFGNVQPGSYGLTFDLQCAPGEEHTQTYTITWMDEAGGTFTKTQDIKCDIKTVDVPTIVIA